MGRSFKAAGCAALLFSTSLAAVGQEASNAGGPYKLVHVDSNESVVLSGMHDGAEPLSLEAWMWRIYPERRDANGEIHDTLAQKIVVRCDSHSVHITGAEYYLDGFGRPAPFTQRLPQTPRADTPLEWVWVMGCDYGVRFQAKNFASLGEIRSEILRRSTTASAAVPPGCHPDR